MRPMGMTCSVLLALASASFQAPAQDPAQSPAARAPRALPNRTPGAPSSPAPTPGSAPSAPEIPPAETWEGSVADGLREVERRAEAGDLPHALALCEGLVAPSGFARWKEAALAQPGWKSSVARCIEPLADALGLAGPAPVLRAEVHFAAGVLADRANDSTLADASFQRARSLAGPGELRGEAGYQLATRALLDGELFRSKIPEISGAQGAPGTSSAAPGGSPLPQGLPGLPGLPNAAGGAPQEPDPLTLARAAYQRARERFIERLRDDWRDADARANTELVQRRLKELDEIEKRRKEEQKKQEQQQKQDQKDKQDQEQQDKDKQDQNDKQDEKKPDEQPKPDEQQKKPEDEKKPEDQKPDEKKDEKAPQPQQTQAEQRELSKEEMTRLLDLLKEREDQWKKLQQQLQHARRGKVKKDW